MKTLSVFSFQRSWSILLHPVSGASRSLFLSGIFILASGFSSAQTQPLTQEELNSQLHLQAQPHFQRLPTGEKMFSWLGQSGFSYFIQASPDLLDWTWAPNIEPGVDAPMSYEVDGPTASGFFRLIRTDQTAADLDAADFDGDGLSNNFELTPRPRPGGIVGFSGLNPNIQTSPLKKDTDADGLDDKWELENGFDPTDNGSRLIDNGPNGDPDNDGVTNLNEQRLGTHPKGNATTTDSDGDGTLDFEDAVPGDNLVSWKRTAESSYALIEIETPYANPSPQDLNDKGEVLFSDGIWSGGNWLPRTAEDGTGAAPGEDGAPYTAHYEGWSRFNHDRKLIGTAHLTFTDGPAAGGDGIGSPAFWVQGQSSPSLLLDSAELWENVPNHFWPIGVTTDGSMVHLISPQPGTTSYLGRYSPTGSLVGQMTGSAGFHPNAQWHHADVTGTGWVASNLTRPASTGQSAAHKVGLWDTSNYPVALPAEAEGWGYPVRAKDLPNGKVVLTAGADNGTTTTGRVFLPNPSGQYEYATKLADKNIELFAGDGSALTSDGKLWRNGNLVPMADLCPHYRELLEAENTISPLRSNKDGTYLVQVQSPTATTSTAIMVAVEVAPEVLTVNSDFDEGRIDPATGYAIPDCDDMPGVDQKTGTGNTKLELDAERNHLDGNYAQGDDVVKDLHKGWFGVKPNSLGNDFWAGANVTIRKIDKVDDDTGYKESGQVRFYAKWGGSYYGISPYNFQNLQPVNLVSAGVNGRSGEGVYGANSTIPGNAQYYIEGVRPGKITLEWRYQKGNADVKYEQTFKVETRKTRQEWLNEVYYQIRLQTKVKTGTAVNVSTYNPTVGFYGNTDNVQSIYYYYRQLFQQMPEKFMWAGMAKTAAAPIYAGMSDLTEWHNGSELTPGTGFGTRDPGTALFINGLLLDGQRHIFQDMAWSHRAYLASGTGAVRHAVETEGLELRIKEAWLEIDSGILSSTQSSINSGNEKLLHREQEIVVQPSYVFARSIWLRQPPATIAGWLGATTVPVNSSGLANAAEWLTANSKKNPLNPDPPHAPTFLASVPGGHLDDFLDRWAWTSNPTSGMLELWTGSSTAGPNFNAAKRQLHAGKSMRSSAHIYSFDPDMLPNE